MKRQSKTYTGMRGGFGLKVIMGLIAAIIVLGVVLWAAFGGASRSIEASDNSKQYATIPLNQGETLSQAFSQRMNNGDVAIDQITADDQNFQNDTNSIYHPVKGTATVQNVPADVFASTSTVANRHWYFNKSIKIKGVGSASTNSYAFVLPDVTSGTCVQVNAALYKDDVSATPPVSAGSLANWESGTVDDSATNAMNTRRTGCVKTSDGKYVYYTLVVIN